MKNNTPLAIMSTLYWIKAGTTVVFTARTPAWPVAVIDVIFGEALAIPLKRLTKKSCHS